MYVGFEAWQDSLLPQLPGAVRAVVEQVFLSQARTFYFQTRTWREMLGPFGVRAGRDIIHLNPVDQRSDVCFVERAWFNDAPMGVYTVATTGGHLPPSGQGDPGFVRLLDPHTLKLEPTPINDVDAAIRLEVSAQPKRDIGSQLPGFAATHHFEALETGTLAKMMTHPNKPYTNLAMGVQYARLFQKYIAEAKAMQFHGYVQNAGAWAFPVVSTR